MVKKLSVELWALLTLSGHHFGYVAEREATFQTEWHPRML